MSESLYERLGGTEGITKIVGSLVHAHLANPAISTRFEGSDVDKLISGAANFMISGTGGPNVYKGKDMLGVHKGMNISQAEFMAVLDDALIALQQNNVGQREQEEMLFILHSMRGDVVLV
jgi:hemoglobin